MNEIETLSPQVKMKQFNLSLGKRMQIWAVMAFCAVYLGLGIIGACTVVGWIRASHSTPVTQTALPARLQSQPPEESVSVAPWSEPSPLPLLADRPVYSVTPSK